MATTSGSYNTVIVTRDQIILDALQDLRVVDATVTTPSANDVTVGALKLNIWLKMVEVKGLFLWLRDTIQIPLITNQFRYTIGPGGDVDTYRPLRALEGSFIRYTCSGSCPPDVQLILISRLEYMQYTMKCAQGVPNSFYYDPQMGLDSYDPAVSKGVLYIWPSPTDLTRTIYLEVQRPIQDVLASGGAFDLPTEWYNALTTGLAYQLADKYEIPEDRIARLQRKADDALEYISNWGAQEYAPMFFQPDYQFTMR